jgi:hypothetical protein
MKMLVKSLLPVFMLAAGLSSLPAQAARKSSGTSADDNSAQMQYQRSKREAQAAYQEALADCRKMRASERSACTKEAKTNLQNDLAEAKKALSSGQ